jgi:hypothetical protein
VGPRRTVVQAVAVKRPRSSLTAFPIPEADVLRLPSGLSPAAMAADVSISVLPFRAGSGSRLVGRGSARKVTARNRLIPRGHIRPRAFSFTALHVRQHAGQMHGRLPWQAPLRHYGVVQLQTLLRTDGHPELQQRRPHRPRRTRRTDPFLAKSSRLHTEFETLMANAP